MKEHQYFESAYMKWDFGAEVRELKPCETYACYWLNHSKKKAEKYGLKKKYQWGIVKTDFRGEIVRNYNVNVIGQWDRNQVKVTDNMHFFEAQPEQKMFDDYCLVEKNAKARWERLSEGYDKIALEYLAYKSHWLHRLADWLIKHLGCLLFVVVLTSCGNITRQKAESYDDTYTVQYKEESGCELRSYFDDVTDSVKVKIKKYEGLKLHTYIDDNYSVSITINNKK